MSATLAHILGTTEGWLAIGVIAVWLVTMCLRTLGSDMDHAIRRHKLFVEARILRMRQQQRMREMGIRR
jgi:hypothetical protein